MSRKEFTLVCKIIVEYLDRYSDKMSYAKLVKKLEELMNECED